jgi:hypothetical protein
MISKEEIRSFINHNSFGGGQYPDFLSRIIANSQEITLGRNNLDPVIYAC